MNALKIATSLTVLAAGAGLCRAEIVLGTPPGGLSTIASLPGSAGVPGNPSRWFEGESGRSLFTYWSGDPLRYSVVLPASSEPWRLGVTARNVNGPLPGSYANFKVKVSVASEAVGTLLIPASDSAWQTSWIDIGPRQGPTEISLKWMNDSYKAGVYDANISYGGLQFASLSIPTPGSGSLLLAGLGVFAMRPRRSRR